jgi:acyl-CoA synthetase (AMP-forming)/AMP-acid ligase II
MIIRGGENIAPAEIEQVLTGHPSVRDAVCFGVPDEKYGELVAAAVTLANGGPGTAAPVEPKALIEHCRVHLAPFKVPVRIDILPEIPRTPTGKVQRRRVAEFVAERRGESGERRGESGERRGESGGRTGS